MPSATAAKLSIPTTDNRAPVATWSPEAIKLAMEGLRLHSWTLPTTLHIRYSKARPRL